MIHFEADERFFSKDYENIVGLKTSKSSTVLARLHIQDVTVEFLRVETGPFTLTYNPASSTTQKKSLNYEYRICVENMALGNTQVLNVIEEECTIPRLLAVMSKQLKPDYRMISVACEKKSFFDVEDAFDDLASSIIDKTSDMVSVYRGEIKLKFSGVVYTILLFKVSKENWNNKDLDNLIEGEVSRFSHIIRRPF